MIKVKREFLNDYKSRGYVDKKEGYKVKSKESFGVFIKEFSYIILEGEYEVIN